MRLGLLKAPANATGNDAAMQKDRGTAMSIATEMDKTK
jgi:hypothetical protein